MIFKGKAAETWKLSCSWDTNLQDSQDFLRFIKKIGRKTRVFVKKTRENTRKNSDFIKIY